MSTLFNFFKRNSLVKRLEKIKSGDKWEREKLIQEYIPFIIKTISSVTNKYIQSENSEEYSIGLEAFNEAIEKYEESRGNFINFAQLVIKSRIKDYLRKTRKKATIISINQFEQEEQEKMQNNLKEEDFTESIMLKDEMRSFEKNLKEFDITFQDLINNSPKHKDTRLNAIRIAKYIFDNEELKNELIKNKKLPRREITNELKVTEKVLKRSRKFIIATVLILDSDSDLLKSYITLDKEGVIDGI